MERGSSAIRTVKEKRPLGRPRRYAWHKRQFDVPVPEGEDMLIVLRNVRSVSYWRRTHLGEFWSTVLRHDGQRWVVECRRER